MNKYIGPDLETRLGVKANEITTRERREILVAQRARLVVNTIFDHVKADIDMMLLPVKQEDGDQADRFIARVQMAGILSLLGVYDSIGRARSESVILARDVSYGDKKFDTVSAKAFAGLDDESMDSKAKAQKMLIKPTSIREGGVTFYASTNGEDHVITTKEAWFATNEMTDRYATFRKRYVDAAHIAADMQRMLGALTDEELNPQFRDVNFVDSISPELGVRVGMTEIPLENIGQDVFLPNWLKQRGVTSTLISAT